jgi:hypothetical protein
VYRHQTVVTELHTNRQLATRKIEDVKKEQSAPIGYGPIQFECDIAVLFGHAWHLATGVTMQFCTCMALDSWHPTRHTTHDLQGGHSVSATAIPSAVIRHTPHRLSLCSVSLTMSLGRTHSHTAAHGAHANRIHLVSLAPPSDACPHGVITHSHSL